MNRPAHAGLPGEAVLRGHGDVASPGRVPADDALGQHVRADDDDFFRVADALKTLVFESNRDFLDGNVDPLQVDHDGAGKVLRLHLHAGVGDQRKLRQRRFTRGLNRRPGVFVCDEADRARRERQTRQFHFLHLHPHLFLCH